MAKKEPIEEKSKTKKELKAALEKKTKELEDQEREAAIRAHLGGNLAILFASVAMAYFLVQSGILSEFLTRTLGSEIIGSFISGIFFTSLFTAAPATVALGVMAQANSIWIVALFGGLGAVVGDLVIYRMLKTHLTDDLLYLLAKPQRKRLPQIFHLRVFKWLFGFLGLIIIASPFPDELGLTFLGIGKLHPRLLIPISFVLNVIGIALLGLVARQLI